MPGIVTLTTDFGTSDSYVGQMKGVLLATAMQPIRLVDITHEVPPQDIRSGARLIAEATPLYPPGSVHLAVVDPGVGTERRIVAVQLADQLYVSPDNGLLSMLLDRFPVQAARVVEQDAVAGLLRLSRTAEEKPEASLWQQHGFQGPSSTFHGRDVMAPVAAWLASGGALTDVGPAVAGELVRLEPLQVQRDAEALLLPVESIDHFGNIITGASQEMVGPHIGGERLSVELAGPQQYLRLVKSYGWQQSGELVALFGSQGKLEIAKVNGSAALELGVRLGDVLRIRVASPANQDRTGGEQGDRSAPASS